MNSTKSREVIWGGRVHVGTTRFNRTSYSKWLNRHGRRRGKPSTSFLPRGLRREDAAYYVGVSPTTFDEMVRDGRMPQPKRVGKRTIWDRRQLDASFEDLPDRNDENDWDEAIRRVRDENQT